ncbi:MAG: hypothetical protein IPI67_26780 [Myxococcales bacterium]|nr:hypothetical protein [Myxococcales bacterium]
MTVVALARTFKEIDMFEDVEAFLDDHDGTMTVSELATLAGESEGVVRRWAREHDVRRCGTTFVFGRDAAMEFVEDLDEDDLDDKDLEDVDADDDADDDADAE